MRKKFYFFAIFACIALGSFAQVKNPVSWSFTSHKKAAGVYEIVATAVLEHPWHIYSQHTGSGGPVPTHFSFNRNPLLSYVGPVRETGALKKIFDNNFRTNVLYFSGKVVFTQDVKVRLSRPGIKTNVSGSVEFMVCDDHQCLPPTKKSFSIAVR